MRRERSATGNTATRRELEATWTHEGARKLGSGGFLYRYKRYSQCRAVCTTAHPPANIRVTPSTSAHARTLVVRACIVGGDNRQGCNVLTRSTSVKWGSRGVDRVPILMWWFW
jgi:hypothetical protein